MSKDSVSFLLCFCKQKIQGASHDIVDVVVNALLKVKFWIRQQHKTLWNEKLFYVHNNSPENGRKHIKRRN